MRPTKSAPAALAAFCASIYANDLYVSIPDRSLVAVAIAQLIHNVPLEPISSASPWVRTADGIAFIVLLSALCVFWVIFAKDKLSSKEAWERNTKYYMRPIALVVLGGCVAALLTVYVEAEESDDALSTGFAFGLIVAVLSYQTYFAALVFRIAFCRRRCCPKSTMRTVAYCFAVSVLGVVGFVLRLSLEIGIVDASSSTGYAAGVIRFVELAALNVHVIALLIVLRRRRKDDFIEAVDYETVRVEDKMETKDEINANEDNIGDVEEYQDEESQRHCCYESNYLVQQQEENQEQHFAYYYDLVEKAVDDDEEEEEQNDPGVATSSDEEDDRRFFEDEDDLDEDDDDFVEEEFEPRFLHARTQSS